MNVRCETKRITDEEQTKNKLERLNKYCREDDGNRSVERKVPGQDEM